jgi:hypothetical protein
MIRIWYFDDAPDDFKKLSNHGGDEDYVMHVPADYYACYLAELIVAENQNEVSRAFGICDISKHKLDDGSTVYIGAHA